MRSGKVALNLGVLAMTVLLWTAFPQTAGASWIGSQVLEIQVESGGLTACQSWSLSLPATMIPASASMCGYYQYDVPPTEFKSGSVVLGSVNMISALYRADPFVSLNIAVTAGSSDTTFTITSATVSFDSMADPDAYAVASLTIIDNNHNGATVTGLYPGGKAYQAIYTDSGGSTAWASLVDPFTASSGHTRTLDDERPDGADTEVIADTLYSIQSQYSFELSAYDSASGTSHFEVTPEPATLALLAFGALALVRRGK